MMPTRPPLDFAFDLSSCSSHLSFNAYLALTKLHLGKAHMSKEIIPPSLDKAVDKANPSTTNGVQGISVRNGPVEEMEIDEPDVNGKPSSKRKSRASTGNDKSYKVASDEDDEDEKPLVCCKWLGVSMNVVVDFI